MKVLLEVEGLNVYYGKLQVLRDVSLSVGEKETVALVGSNGAGKTTLLNAIAGFIKAESGRIVFDGTEMTNLPPHLISRMGISLVPQERELFPEMTVLENIELGAAHIPSARDKMEENLEFVFELFPKLKERINQKARSLSGGEQRMLAIARALMSNPKLLMLDEPSLGLQPSLVLELFSVLETLNDRGLAVLIVEQYVHNCFRIAKRGYVLENGEIAIQGYCTDLIEKPEIRKAYLGV
ncbi:ABC transporter ATP-binding protein [Archaeoglobus neptunius]|uniref:ABC transporter ATP-binding protein n=1 Tax=Archaeoglobus neptunius TaxID=2798580 RepID=UPI001925EC1A|nr:ABC transporter ATP-binding protein [Archaeoglobus neptunius]